MRVDVLVEQFRLQAQFELLARARLQGLAGRVRGRLGREDARVAAVGRQLFVELVDQARIRRQLGVDLVADIGELVEICVAVDGTIVPVRQAPAQVDGQALRCLQAGTGVQAELLAAVVIAVGKGINGLRDIVIWMEDVDWRIVSAAVLEILVYLAVVGAHDQVVAAAKRLERRGQPGVEALRLPVAAVVPADQAAVTRDRIGRTIGPSEVARRFILFAVQGGDLELAAVVQFVIEFGKVFGDLFRDVVPGRVEVGGAGHVEQAPVFMCGQAEGGTALVFLPGDAARQHGARCQIDGDGAVQQRFFRIHMVDEGTPVFIRRHQAAAHLAIRAQGPCHVRFRIVAVPGTCAEHAAGGKGVARPLAHQVDGAARVACTLEQAGGAAQHFHAVIDGQAEAGRQVASRAGRCHHAIDLHGIERIAARVKIAVVAARAAGLDGDARHAAHGVVQAQQILVVQLLARQHGDGLGNLAQALPALADAHRLRRIRLGQLAV
ncbi:hypothetical protein D3C85_461240 [compost metagenome]